MHRNQELCILVPQQSVFTKISRRVFIEKINLALVCCDMRVAFKFSMGR